MVLAQVVVKEEAGGAEALSTHNIMVNIQSPFNKRSLISLDTFLYLSLFSLYFVLQYFVELNFLIQSLYL